MVISHHIEPEGVQQAIDWHTDHFEHVKKVYCGSDFGDGCGELLCLEVSGGTGYPLDERGVARVTVGDNLLGTRVRLDEHDKGRMVGYQCKCGNDTRLSEGERHHRKQWFTDYGLGEKEQIAEAIKDCGKHKPQYKHKGGVHHYETFRVEEVK